MTRRIDAHVAAAQQRSNNRTLVLVNFGGVGDQLSGLLAAVTVALASGRRLEVAPDMPGSVSYIGSAGFELLIDGAYTGDVAWIDRSRGWWAELRTRNSSGRARSLPRLEVPVEPWAFTMGQDHWALSTRLVVPSPSGTYPPQHRSVLRKPHELFLGGNVGAYRRRRSKFSRHLRTPARPAPAPSPCSDVPASSLVTAVTLRR